MKSIQLAAYYALIMLMLIRISGTSSPLSKLFSTEEPVVTRPSNVIYPSLLLDHREASLQYVQQFSDRRREYLINTYKKGTKYFSKITTVLKKYNVPQELKVLIALESGFNANAVSSAGAKGYWQFMDEVAVEYGLKICSTKTAAATAVKAVKGKVAVKVKQTDDRTNFTKSTNAAARYLRDRLKNLDNDVLLVVASYNCGIGNVWEAMKKSGIANPDFWDIKKYLPAETRSYVMNFIALNVIFNNYDKFLENNMVFNDVVIPLQQTVAQKEGMISALTLTN